MTFRFMWISLIKSDLAIFELHFLITRMIFYLSKALIMMSQRFELMISRTFVKCHTFNQLS